MRKKTVLVTGASRGIGKSIALRFAEEGCNLAISCIHRGRELSEVQAQIQSGNSDCLAFVGDMGDFTACETLFRQIQERFQGVDILINNAGISHIGLLQDMAPSQWEQLLRSNLTSVFHCCRQAIPYMVQQHQGKIINISSVWGVSGASCEAAYSAAKGGVNALTKALAKELAPAGIQVNAIACGAIDTEMNQWLSPDERQALRDEIPAGRLGTPQEVAHLAWQLTCENTYLTGQIIQLDGGWI